MNNSSTLLAPSVDAPPQQRYYVTQETPALLRRLAMGNGITEINNIVIQEISNCYRDRMLALLQNNLQDVAITFFSEEEINAQLNDLIQQERIANPLLEVVCLDRFLLPDSETSIKRFEITRLTDNSKDARPGSPTIESQLDELFVSIGNRKILLVDDGLFTGGSIRDAIKLLLNKGLSVEKVLAFVRDPKQAPQEIDGIPITACLEMTDLKDWVDFRDFLTLCGRTFPRNGESYYTTQYYLAPSDDGRKASLDGLMKRQFLEFSRRSLEIEDAMLEAMENTVFQRPLLVEDIARAGFAISRFPTIELPAETDQYRAYIAKAQRVVDAMLLPKPDQIILDMDGTFYPLDGFAENFLGSRLEKELEAKAIAYIMTKEGCDNASAMTIFQEAKKDSIGASNFFARRYTTTRNEYFDATWGQIDEEQIVRPSFQARELLDQLRLKAKGLILVTSAPKSWMSKVMKKLGINPQEYFHEVLTAEDFSVKSEVFSRIANMYPGQTIISAGDTFESDIAPAVQAGMTGFLVNSTNPLTNLLYTGTIDDEL